MVSRSPRIKEVRPVLWILLLPMLAAGCASTSEPRGPAAITGPIVARNLTISIGTAPTIHVKQAASDPCGIIFALRSSTRVLRRTGDGRMTSASESDLTVGQRVSVWTDVVLDSCPAQASADAVEILE